MPGAEGFVHAYNTQIAVEADFQWIVGQRVTQATNDKQQLVPTVKAIRAASPPEAAAGSHRQRVLLGGESEVSGEEKIEGLHRDRPGVLSGPPAAGSARGPLPEGATRVDRMRRKLQTKVGAAIYSRRKTLVEPAFGQIKQARGFRQFLLRGLEKVQGEWGHDLSHAQHSEATPALLWIKESKKRRSQK